MNDDKYKEVASTIKTWRKKHRLSQKGMAQTVGCALSKFRLVESGDGKRCPKLTEKIEQFILHSSEVNIALFRGPGSGNHGHQQKRSSVFAEIDEWD